MNGNFWSFKAETSHGTNSSQKIDHNTKNENNINIQMCKFCMLRDVLGDMSKNICFTHIYGLQCFKFTIFFLPVNHFHIFISELIRLVQMWSFTAKKHSSLDILQNIIIHSCSRGKYFTERNTRGMYPSKVVWYSPRFVEPPQNIQFPSPPKGMFTYYVITSGGIHKCLQPSILA